MGATVSRKNGGLYPKRCPDFFWAKERKSDYGREINPPLFRLLRLIRINLNLFLRRILPHWPCWKRMPIWRRNQVHIKLRPLDHKVNSKPRYISWQTVSQIHLVFICPDIFPWFHTVLNAPFDIQKFATRHCTRDIMDWKNLPHSNSFLFRMSSELPAAAILIVEHLCIRTIMTRIKTERMHRMLIHDSLCCAGCQPKWDQANTEPDKQTPKWYFLHSIKSG